METERFAEGLFLKNYLGTVSTVPKSRQPNQPDTKFCISSYCGEDYRTCSNHSVKGRMPDCSNINHYLKGKNADEIDFYKAERNGIDSPKTFIRKNTITHFNQPENEKKKEKKWTLGVLFRKKCKKNAEDISDDSEEDIRKNLVNRHKCKKEKKKSKVRSTASGFDMIISPKREDIQGSRYEESAHFPKESHSRFAYDKPVKNCLNSASGTPARFINRHPNFSEDEKIKCSKECLQAPRNIRKNLSVCHVSSLNNENTEGRKCRKKVMARAEAKRDMICDDSSSDEYDSVHSNSSLCRNNVDQLGGRKPRRSKRLSRNDSFSPKSPDSLTFEKASDSTIIGSDFQERIQFFPNVKNDSSTLLSAGQAHENAWIKNHSRNVSEVRNIQKQQIIDPVESCQSNTFPFVHSLQKNKNSYASFSNLPPNNNVTCLTQNQSDEGKPYISYSPQESQSFMCNRQSRHLGNRRDGKNPVINSEYTQLSNSDPFFSRTTNKKNWSSSQDIRKANFLRNCDIERWQEQPVKEYNHVALNSLPKSQIVLSTSGNSQLGNFEKREKENEMEDFYFPNNILSALESQTRLGGNETDTRPFISTQTVSPNTLAKTLRRSGSENLFGDSESHGNFEQNRSSSYQNIPTYTHIESRNPKKKHEKETRNNMLFHRTPNLDSFECQTAFSPEANISTGGENRAEETTSLLRYYADLSPRSRNPIHITCDPALVSREFLVNCSRVASKPGDAYVSKQSESSASAFWKAKDQEVQLRSFGMQNDGIAQNSYKPDVISGNIKLNRARATSVKSTEATSVLNQPFAHDESNCFGSRSQNQFKNYSLGNDLKENFNENELPFRTITQEIIIPQSQSNKSNSEIDFSSCSSNLNDALNELENIYNGLKCKDLTGKSTTGQQKYRSNENVRQFVSQGTEEILDLRSGVTTENLPVHKEYLKSSTEKDSKTLPVNQPDKIYDDMAFRRMNVKDRTNAKTFISPSYLRFSFTSPQVGEGSPTFQKKLPTHLKEPDVTYDDVVFRNIRRANNTLKTLDPQPPFGIPIGIFTPAPCSNYLHAVPKERFRSTFTSCKTPDIVKDDLAFRNLRKDNKSMINLPRNDFAQNDPNLLKKRAVRSLSANISNIMQTNNSPRGIRHTNDNAMIEKKEERTQSLTNLVSGYECDREISRKALREFNEKSSNEFFEKFAEIKNKTGGDGKESLDSLKQSKSNEELKRFGLTTSSEISYYNNGGLQKKSDLVFSPKHSCPSVEVAERKSARSPVVALSKFPAAAPLLENISRENALDFFLNENKLESLLSVLKNEFTVGDLDRQLNNLEAKPSSENKMIFEDNLISTAAEFNANSLDKVKRRRNLSLSNMSDSKVDENWAARTNSLERRKWPSKKNENLLQFEYLYERAKNHSTLKESNSMVDVKFNGRQILSGEALPEKSEERTTNGPGAPVPEEHCTSKSSSKFSAKEPKLNSPLVLENEEQSADVTPVGVFVNGELGETFQEIYEYNCRLIDKRNTEPDNTLIEKKNEKLLPSEASSHKSDDHSLSDVEQEFEKLHKEQSKSTKNTKETKMQQNEFPAVDNCIADITTNGDRESSAESNFLLPFNEKRCGKKKRGSTSEFSSKREGEAKKYNLKTNLWLACTYALAFAFNFQQIDFLIALGTVLAVVLVIAILIL